MAGSIIVKPAVQQRFDSFIQRGRVLFVSAPCGFGKSTLADALLEGRSVLRLSAGAPDFSLDALPEAWDILLIDDFQQLPEGSEEQTLCQLKLSGVSVKQDGTLFYSGEEQTAAVIKAATAYGENEVKFTFSAEENSTYGDLPAFTNAGSYTVYYKAVADNHETASGSFTVTIDKATLQNVSVAQRNELTYNGVEQTVEVDTSATTVDGSALTFTYSMEKDGAYGELPTFTNAGSYTVYYKAEADNHETFIGSFTVTIEKAIVTVTALDKTAYVRRKAPDLSNPVKDKDYTVSDLFGDDQLTGTIKLAYVDEDGNEIAPNMSQPGKTIIRASGLTAPNENYAVVFVDGTLTILPRSSSGGSNQGDYVIKVITGEGGSLSPSGDVGVRKGEDLTFTITPDAGYAVADVKIDGKSIGATRTKTSMRSTPSRSAS